MPIKRYTRLVFLGKNLLLLLSLCMIGVVVWIGTNNDAENGGRMVFTGAQKSENLQNIMVKPRYLGVDVHNRPYTVTAESGLQLDKDNIKLTKINADMTGDNNAWMSLMSGTGVMNITTKKLVLSDGVEVYYEGGYEFRTDHANVDVNKGTAEGDSKIEGQGPAGTISANKFYISERGNKIRFNDLVRVIMYH